MEQHEAAPAFADFVRVVQALRTPGTGCPWDLEQNHRSLRPYLTEETHEVLEAIDAGDDDALREELGDLLLQVVLHAQLGRDRGAFDIAQVVRGITAKMVRRHPHVFGSARVSNAADVARNWERIKAEEARGQDPTGGEERLPAGLPALLRAQRVGARRGVQQELVSPVLPDIRAGLAALEKAAQRTEESPADASTRAGLEPTLGGVLFGLCQLANRLGLSAEDCLRAWTGRLVDRRSPG
jgi:tetrapyrrole methylase family protein/MazG family protein